MPEPNGGGPDRTTIALRRFLETRDSTPKGDPLLLRRFLEPRRKAAPGELCEFCTEPLADAHSHVVNVESRALMCACRACFFLFAPEGAAGGKYRAVPEDPRYDPDFVLTASQWDALQIPVGMAFLFHNSVMGRAAAFYPSPAGATESLLPLDIWEDLRAANPSLQEMAPDVEALLVRWRGGGSECYIVPIDLCYELVGVIRRWWKGFDGGEEARVEIDAFFARLGEKSTVARGRGAA